MAPVAHCCPRCPGEGSLTGTVPAAVCYVGGRTSRLAPFASQYEAVRELVGEPPLPGTLKPKEVLTGLDRQVHLNGPPNNVGSSPFRWVLLLVILRVVIRRGPRGRFR